MGDLMDILTRYVESDVRKDPGSDEDKVRKNKKGEDGEINHQGGNPEGQK